MRVLNPPSVKDISSNKRKFTRRKYICRYEFDTHRGKHGRYYNEMRMSFMKTAEQIYNFISKQKVAFIASVDDEGFPNMKAMLMPRKIDNNCFYFSTNTSSMRVAQFRKNPKASIYFYNKGRFRYEGVMLIGTMEILEDEHIKNDIWREGDTMYYKKGVSDPDYCVLKFTAIKGRYYCNLKTVSFTLNKCILETSGLWRYIDAIPNSVEYINELRGEMNKHLEDIDN